MLRSLIRHARGVYIGFPPTCQERTPFGAYRGALASLTAPELGAVAIRGAVQQAGIDPALVQEVLMGNVFSAGLGQAPSRQAALAAGLPAGASCTDVNKVCASGLKAVMLGAASIQTGLADIVVAGGMESMSRVPYLLQGARRGLRGGHAMLLDGLLSDGLEDPLRGGQHMGQHAEACAAEHGISRQEQDDHAVEAYGRAMAAAAEGSSGKEITPVAVQASTGAAGEVVTTDELLGPGRFDEARLRSLKPVFGGPSITAGNASALADGAAALVLVSAERASELGLHVLAHVRGMADACQQPELYPTTPALAVRKLLAAAGAAKERVAYWEINQAFSVVDIVNQRLLGLDPARVNVHGGAVALGHPLGASGAALLVRLLSVLDASDAKIGMAAICNGGGGASAMMVQRTHTRAEQGKNEATCGLEPVTNLKRA